MWFPCSQQSLYSPKWPLSSDHAPLTITIPISEEIVNTHKSNIKKGSNEETQFLEDTANIIKNLNISNLMDIHMLENIVNKLAIEVEEAYVVATTY